MKKTVSIVTLPLNKEGWDKDDIISHLDGCKLADFDLKKTVGAWKAQQLLVLSDDEPKDGDICDDYCDVGDEPYTHLIGKCLSVDKANGWIKFDGYETGIDWCKKILASYPQIEGTLPISKETVQAWIDAGIPDSAGVELVNEYAIDGHTIVGAANSLDEHGNLLLQFSSTKDAEDKALIREAFKPKQVPTDEDIAFFAKEYIKFQEPQSFYNTYIDSYKQALKDMGYE